MPMFRFVCKKSHFLRQSRKYQFNYALFYVQGQLRLEIKICDHFWTHFDGTKPIVISESRNELPLEIMFLKVSLIVSICVKLQ